MKDFTWVLNLLDEAYEKKTWHGPNLRQALRGVTAKEAAWRPGKGRHNIWEETLHAAYWKWRARRKLGDKDPFPLQGSNFYARPEPGKTTEEAWQADKAILDREHRAMRTAAVRAIKGVSPRDLKMLYGVAFHDVYHAGQIRHLRRLMGKPR